MKNWNLAEIKKQCDDVFEPNGWIKKGVSPLDFLLSCGWDKASYDEYATKLNNDALIGNELDVFKSIYTTMLKILANLEKLSLMVNPKNGKPYLNPMMCKITLESYGMMKKALPNGKEIINRRAILAKQQEETNTSEIDFNKISKEI